ncbi:MAG: Mrp/NBP35 family ATP-binding protein [Candidatus Cloacimonetes bacterium]|nr:Mrp/NBP35 family ATP-binding protein [Candidatus Cloacimonadota bacterium]
MHEVNIDQDAEKKIREEKQLQENIDRIKHKLIVISGKGGVGKSTVSVNLAYGLALTGKKVGILDIDIHGPSIAKMLGIEGQKLGISAQKQRPMPIRVQENLYAMTIATLLQSADDPVIWRGPLKMGVIKQFLQDIEWPELDYLIVDSPPGTGDEPLSIVQILKKVDGSLIVSTPQDVSFLDARKTIKFSQKMSVPVIGIIENMSGFTCPHCGEKVDIFPGKGAAKAALDFSVDILGKIPIDVNIVKTSDSGKAYIKDFSELSAAKEMQNIIKKVIKKVEKK